MKFINRRQLLRRAVGGRQQEQEHRERVSGIWMVPIKVKDSARSILMFLYRFAADFI